MALKNGVKKSISSSAEKSAKNAPDTRWHSGLKDETKYSIWGIVCLGFSLFFVLVVCNKAGVAGEYVRVGLDWLFGTAIFLVPAVLFFISISLFSSYRPRLLASSLIGGLFIFVSSLSLIDIVFGKKTGGYVGFLAALPFLKLIDFWASIIVFSMVFIVGFLIMSNIPISFASLARRARERMFFSKSKLEESDAQSQGEVYGIPSVPADAIAVGEKTEENGNEMKKEPGEKYDVEEENENGIKTKILSGVFKKFSDKKFNPPPFELLESDKGKPSAGDIKANSNIIKRTFQNFGISVEMDEIRIGPSVTQYTLKPAEGVKLSRITGLNNDLSLALASHPIRIEAPIPGKSLVGIEVPNRSSSLVGLRSLLQQTEYLNSELPLLLALGRNVAGRPVYASIAKMPHVLIAGATGSGKSVAIHSLIMSLLYRHSPADLQLLMIDPKRVELTMYNNLPYLLSPVITEAKKAIVALKWATKEMERRYDVLLAAGARDINSYHKNGKTESMPYIVVIIDELADIMMSYPREFESSIVRLAQMSRAVGIHLVVSTQRPSVEVITGLIKANITSRVAFQVASQVDSRTILDMAGAEKLLGNGDMLYLSGDSAKPRRIQGTFVSESEVKKVVNYLLGEYENFDSSEINLGNGEMQQSSIFDETPGSGDDEEDELYEQAREIIIQSKRASTSLLQRRLRVGYSRAARLLDMMEERGVVGPPDGSRPREILDLPPENYDA
ncbi:MAG: DNA translocase FtsK [Candidatus Pacebacteria bacterium]|nr:DNA translocase FtsK [Candidatus Paceibacterota bacterium]